MGAQNGGVGVGFLEGAQGGQRSVIGLPIVKKQPYDGVRGALFGEGFRIPDGVRGEQDGAVVDGLDECAVLAGGVAGKGKHHNAAIPKHVPAYAELRVLYSRAGLEGSTRRQPVCRHQIMEESFGESPPAWKRSKFFYAVGGGPTLCVREVQQSADVIGMQVREDNVADF